jgi:hypothetical protein
MDRFVKKGPAGTSTGKRAHPDAWQKHANIMETNRGSYTVV